MRNAMKKFLTTALALVMATAGVAQANEILIFTGGAPTGKGSAYHEGIGEGIAQLLKPIARELRYDIKLVPTNGSVDNAMRLAANTGSIAVGIGQGGLNSAPIESGDTVLLRSDLPGECAQAFTAESRIENWASIAENAGRVTWVVPRSSGSEGFIRKIYETEAPFAGVTPTFEYVSGADAIIGAVKDPRYRGRVGFSYSYPNPTSGLIHAAAEENLGILGVLSPAVARTDVAFYLNRAAPYKLSMFGFGETKTVRTMCSHALLMTSDISKIEDEWTREDAAAVIAVLRDAQAADFVPSSGPLASMMSKIEALSEEFGVAEMVEDLKDQVPAQLK
jgi:hypothetical protein